MNAWQEFFFELNNQYVNRRGNPGESIDTREWDVLLILNDCRMDLLHEVADEYDFVQEIDTLYSLGSKSPDWMRRNFKSTYTNETV